MATDTKPSPLTAAQKRAVEQLRKALDNCASVGLTGGVYDCGFRVWRTSQQPDPRDCGNQFFDLTYYVGEKQNGWDGGSGV